MESEIHLIIIWEKARFKAIEIFEDIKSRFSIMDCFEIEWSHNLVPSNYTRFYGVHLPKNSFKQKHCGSGKFLLYIVQDDNPVYEERKTSHGQEIVNINLFDAKCKYRRWTGGGHKIHATNNVDETNHDLTLLLGINYNDYLCRHGSTVWKGTTTRLRRDITGARGWESLKDFFYTLNNTVDYVVMRGEDNLSSHKSGVHQDIDVLVKEWENTIFIMNGKIICYSSPYRPKILVSTQTDGEFLFDLWMSKLTYHSLDWHEDMIETRIYTGLYYKLNLTNEFYSLLYHCFVNKKEFAYDYLLSLKKQFYDLGLDKKYDSQSYHTITDMYYQVLQDYLESKGFDYCSCKEDTHCYYNNKIAAIKPALYKLKELGVFTDTLPYDVAYHSASGYLYYTAYYNNQRVFIKYGGIGDTCRNEYFFSKKMYMRSPNHFIEPLLFDHIDHDSYIVFPFIEAAEPLQSYNPENSPVKAMDLRLQLIEIYSLLYSENVMHRDIRPENFLISNGNVILIDFQFAIDLKKKSELECVKSNIRLALLIGGGKYRYKTYAWNDSYSFMKMFQCLNIPYIDDAFPQECSVYMPLASYFLYMLRKKIVKSMRDVRRLFSMNR